MPGWNGTLAQRASIAIGAFYLLTGIAGLIVNPDFGTGARNPKPDIIPCFLGA